MNFCKTCLFRDEKGICGNFKLSEDHGYTEKESSDMLIYSYTESGNFWVGENFGCVHHKQKKEIY